MRLKAMTLTKPESTMAAHSTHVDTGAPCAAADCNTVDSSANLARNPGSGRQAAHEEHAADEDHAEEGHGGGNGDADILAARIYRRLS